MAPRVNSRDNPSRPVVSYSRGQVSRFKPASRRPVRPIKVGPLPASWRESSIQSLLHSAAIKMPVQRPSSHPSQEGSSLGKRSQQLPRPVLKTLAASPYLILKTNLGGTFSFQLREEWDSKRLSILPKIIQLSS